MHCAQWWDSLGSQLEVVAHPSKGTVRGGLSCQEDNLVEKSSEDP